jgi:hypothetical protein
MYEFGLLGYRSLGLINTSIVNNGRIRFYFHAHGFCHISNQTPLLLNVDAGWAVSTVTQLETYEDMARVLRPLHKRLKIGCWHIQQLNEAIDSRQSVPNCVCQTVGQLRILPFVKHLQQWTVVASLEKSIDAFFQGFGLIRKGVQYIQNFLVSCCESQLLSWQANCLRYCYQQRQQQHST